MKTFTLLIASVMASLAVADVRIFTDTQCMANEKLIDTTAGNCYNIQGGIYSARGCSVGHNLRVYTGSGCSGTYQEKAPQKCANLDGSAVGSIRCV